MIMCRQLERDEITEIWSTAVKGKALRQIEPSDVYAFAEELFKAARVQQTQERANDAN